MTPSLGRTRPSTFRTLAVAAAIGSLTLTGCDLASSRPMPTVSLTSTPPPVAIADPATRDEDAPGAAPRRVIDAANERLRSDPADADTLLTLGLAWYQHARETWDPTDYARADEAFMRRLVLLPDDPKAFVGQGTVALARHRFAEALELGTRARELSPGDPQAWGVVSDALVELGRYPEALEAVQRMVDLRPDLASYSRVSYQRELRGDLDGAIDAMERAIIAGGPETEGTAYVRVLLGDLWSIAGDLDRAAAAYVEALGRVPDFLPALAGLGRVRAATGDLDAAIALLTEATDRVPEPGSLVTLGELQMADGRASDAGATFALVRDIQALFAANGVTVDLELARFEADHGDATVALDLARRAWAATPTVRAADALGWALYRAGRADEARPWADRAMALGSVEPGYLFHAGMIAAAQGDASASRAWLGELLDRSPGWSPLWAPVAHRTLAGLAGTAEVAR